MKKDSQNLSRKDDLRQRAETQFNEKGTTPVHSMSQEDIQALVHELQVHQIELELQNEELQRAQQELEVSREKYSDLYDFAPVGYVTFDGHGLILEANLTASTMLRVNRSDLINRNFGYFLSPASKSKFADFCRDVTRSDSQQTCEVEIMLAGRPFEWVEIKGTAEESLIRAALIDNTESRRAQEAIRRLAAIIESSEDAIIGITFFGIIESWNKGAEHLYGYTAREVIGKSITMLLPPGHEDEIHDLLKRIMEGEYIHHRETMQVRRDGKFIEIALSMTPTFDGDGKLSGVASIAYDITEQKRTEEIMRTMSRLEAAALLSGGIAHDFNNLMAVVMGNAGLLLTEFQNRPTIREALEAILQSAESAGRLALQMLAFARGGRLQSSILNLNDTVSKALELHRSALLRRIVVHCNLADNLLNVDADATQMSQIAINLITNAIESIDGHGKITVSTQNVEIGEEFALQHAGLKPGPHVRISIEDTGHGMSPDCCQHVFEPFYSTKEQGRGLGLAAVYGIVKNHGGHISVESSVGDGSCFTVWLPATEKELIMPPMEDVKSAGGHETILVVDDEPHIVKIMSRALESSGYEVISAENGKEAMRIATDYDGDIHLIILDMGMPVMDGVEAFGLLKNIRPKTGVLICSGYDKYDSARSLLESGARSFLQKPFRIERLIQEVRHALDTQMKYLNQES